MIGHVKVKTIAVEIETDNSLLKGDLQIPANATSIILFAHGSGSSRFSPRNRYVAQELNQNGLGTFLFDLLTAEEETIDTQTREYRFNIQLLAQRLLMVTDWISNHKDYSDLKIGYFGSSTGAAAALIAAAERSTIVRAVVSRGGRPDLAGDSLSLVNAPTLLIVGGLDDVVIDLNNEAKSKMNCEVKLQIIPEATHLFEESGKLEEVVNLASAWFLNKILS